MKRDTFTSMVSYLLIVATVCITRNAAQPSKDGDDNTLKPVKFTPIKSADSKEMKEEKKETKAELVEPVPDISDSVRERIEADSKRVGRIAENLVGVQGDINRVEKEVLGKVFDMSSMKSFLDKHEIAIKDHEKFTQTNARDRNGRTCLHFAAIQGNLAVAETIVTHPRFASIGVKDHLGFTPQQRAKANRNETVSRYIQACVSSTQAVHLPGLGCPDSGHHVLEVPSNVTVRLSSKRNVVVYGV